VSLGVHVPQRPGWNCCACHGAWPCERAKDLLSADYDDSQEARDALARYLNDLRSIATLDLLDTGVSAVQLDERFTAWLPSRTG
jgi:hypothetical protein